MFRRLDPQNRDKPVIAVDFLHVVLESLEQSEEQEEEADATQAGPHSRGSETWESKSAVDTLPACQDEALDVEPPHSEMPPRASAHDSQALRTHASQAYAGTKPGVLVTPCVVVVVWKTYCSYGLIVFSSAQILGMY